MLHHQKLSARPASSAIKSVFMPYSFGLCDNCEVHPASLPYNLSTETQRAQGHTASAPGWRAVPTTARQCPRESVKWGKQGGKQGGKQWGRGEDKKAGIDQLYESTEPISRGRETTRNNLRDHTVPW